MIQQFINFHQNKSLFMATVFVCFCLTRFLVFQFYKNTLQMHEMSLFLMIPVLSWGYYLLYRITAKKAPWQ